MSPTEEMSPAAWARDMARRWRRLSSDCEPTRTEYAERFDALAAAAELGELHDREC